MAVQVSVTGPESALVSWTGYNTAGLVGFAGFRLYVEEAPFTLVESLTPIETFGAALTLSDALILYNGIGVRQTGTAQLVLRNSVIKFNETNAHAATATTLVATQNWWGTAVSATIAEGLSGPVDFGGALSYEPILTPAIGLAGGGTQTGSRSIQLRLAARTGAETRVSEDSTFQTVFFAPFTNQVPFTLSEGGGQKTIYAQFRSVTSHTDPPIALALDYITAGPVIQSFNLAEGQSLTRPFHVTATASAALGLAVIEFYVDNVLQASGASANFSHQLDVRNFSTGVHRVKLLARDNSGNIATLERNVFFTPTPPPAPVITTPASNITLTENGLLVGGTAEPLLEG